MTDFSGEKRRADLQTAQNRMFDFIQKAMADARHKDFLDLLEKDQSRQRTFYKEVKQMLLSLLAIPEDQREHRHIGIVDSGKRTIESLVAYFCPPEENANVVVNTENYVAFNKFSAVTALQQQKQLEFRQPFALEMGQALTIDSPDQFAMAQNIISNPDTKTLWLAWNSTSTGILERVERLVEFRNSCQSNTLIIVDAASLPLFSNQWLDRDPALLPDIFFFSLRKQGLPYDGPQHEAAQAKNSGAVYIFNDRALQRAKEIQGSAPYDIPSPEQAAGGQLTNGEQRSNHLCHLYKLHLALTRFLDMDRSMAAELDLNRKQMQSEILQAFQPSGSLYQQGFRLLTHPPAQSENVYIIRTPEGIKASSLVEELKNKGIAVSLSMHPRLPSSNYFRFACYPANTLSEIKLTLEGIRQTLPEML